MSFNQKYTWYRHINECPKCKPQKGKRVKRSSKEATTCFDKAFQTKVKEILKSRPADAQSH